MASTVSDGTTTITPWFVKGYQAAQAGRNITHDVIGDPGGSVTLYAPSLRAGTLSLYFQSNADAEAAKALHNQTATFTFADSDVTTAGMRYIVAGSGVQITLDEDSLLWVVAISFQEVAS